MKKKNSGILVTANGKRPDYAARNNLRAMKKGDLAFFYHSNCKEPGIVGTMEVVQEHSPDRTSLCLPTPPLLRRVMLEELELEHRLGIDDTCHSVCSRS